MVSMGIHTFEDYHDPQEMFNIFNEPLRGRHIAWDEKSLKLRDSTQHTLGFYDAAVGKEGVQENAAIVFGDVEYTSAIQKFSAATFSEAILEIHAALGPLLYKHQGYNVVPQREGHFMFSFKTILSAAYFHRDFQNALLKLKWPPKLNELAMTSATYSEKDDKLLLFKGLTVCLGLSFGPLSKTLESGRANYTGRKLNVFVDVIEISLTNIVFPPFNYLFKLIYYYYFLLFTPPSYV